MPLSVKTESGMRYASAHVKVDGVWRKARQVYQKTATGWRPVWSYEWTTGDWGGCSATCGGGTQTRTVDCDRNDGVRVADALCETTKPAASNACNTQPCYTYNWYTGRWGSCNASCGTGTQTRTVTCKRTSDNATLSDSICSAFSGKPSASASCTSCSGCSYSETAMVYAKVKQLNALAVDGRTNWTYSQARSAILSNYSSVTQWWNVAGRNESICPYPSAACCSGYKYSQ